MSKELEAAAISHHKKVNPWTANDPYFKIPEHNQTIEAFLAGAKWQSQHQAETVSLMRAALGEAREEEKALTKQITECMEFLIWLKGYEYLIEGPIEDRLTALLETLARVGEK